MKGRSYILAGSLQLVLLTATTSSFQPSKLSLRISSLSPLHPFACGDNDPCRFRTQPLFAETTKNKKTKKKGIVLKDLLEEMERNPSAFITDQERQAATKKKYRRTRKRVENPKQNYVYAAQRRKMDPNLGRREEEQLQSSSVGTNDDNSPLVEAEKMGVSVSALWCEPVIGGDEPEIIGRIRLDPEMETAGSMAYVISKPVGWSILGGNRKKKTKAQNNQLEKSDDSVAQNEPASAKEGSQRVVSPDGDVIEFDEADFYAALTPEELEELEKEGGGIMQGVQGTSQDQVTPREVVQSSPLQREVASFKSLSRPSIVGWLKDQMEAEGTPIRGGNHWVALNGATQIDDSGLVLLCPKALRDNVFVDVCKYVAVIGCGNNLAPKARMKDDAILRTKLQIDEIAKLRKGRGDDSVITVSASVAESFSTCTGIIDACQQQFQDGIRGDPMVDPFERRAPRRLIHCDAMTVSSLTHDDTVRAETEYWPDDISVVAERRNGHEFAEGSFLGRAGLYDNEETTAYREINGAGDGFAGWVVDRYDKWLFVQHDDKNIKGPLPSLHDGNTAGVYYLSSKASRDAMGRGETRPRLLEGQPTPDILPIKENGVTYHVSLDRDLSTGMFLDQRRQRAWLLRHCNKDTRVLNCFAHCGAFSIAAACAGASTVSLDLEKKWLDRIPPQMEANGIDFAEKHDSIYGDCFDWVARLAKRGELFDIVILDPPSSSVGKKKKRWSVKNDMAELVALAAPLVKHGGFLWTSTNCAQLSAIRFARMCKKGLDQAGFHDAKLDRIVPMPEDFPCIGTQQSVKNLVWRLP